MCASHCKRDSFSRSVLRILSPCPLPVCTIEHAAALAAGLEIGRLIPKANSSCHIPMCPFYMYKGEKCVRIVRTAWMTWAQLCFLVDWVRKWNKYKSGQCPQLVQTNPARSIYGWQKIHPKRLILFMIRTSHLDVHEILSKR